MTSVLSRPFCRPFVLAASFMAAVPTVAFGASASPAEPAASSVSSPIAATKLDVYKSPTCGCCADWVTHVEKAGFTTEVTEAEDMNAVKQKLAIEPRYQSCHTTVTQDGNYFFEGHVPAKLIEQFLKEKPEGAAGLAVPGMPLGSPGMEMGGRFQPYHVVQINRDGSIEKYATMNAPEDQH